MATYETPTPAQLYEHVRRLLLHHYGRLIVGRGWELEDVVQDVVLRCHRYPHDPERGAVSTWVSLHVRGAVSYLREQEDRRVPEGTATDADGEPCDPAERAVGTLIPADVDERVLGSLESHIRTRHPESGERLASVLRALVAGHQITDIAAEMGCSRQRAHQLVGQIRAEAGRWADGLPPRAG